MKQTMMVKLQPTDAQASALLLTMERFNAACDAIAVVAFREQMVSKFRLQKIVYHDIREAFGLSAQLCIRAIAKTAEAYKRDKKIQVSFRPHGAITYDERILSWKGVDRVSLLTVNGRVLVPVRFGAYQAARLDRIKGQADLIYRDGTFFLAVTVDAPEAEPHDPTDVIGLDMGIVNIVTDSDGQSFSGAHLNSLRIRHNRLRAKLQHKGTKPAKRLLNKRRRKEQRFATNTNHIISKQVVAKASDTRRAIALENLSGIRERTGETVRKAQRRTHHSWSFHQLRFFVEYKARMAGVRVVAVDPRNTSRQCACCGHVAKENRRSQSEFLCVSCGYAANADYNAAMNLRERGRASVNMPYVGEQSASLAATHKPTALAVGG